MIYINYNYPLSNIFIQLLANKLLENNIFFNVISLFLIKNYS